MTVGDSIDYEALTQDAMRGVVRAVLKRVVADGLPGNHHFYVAFNTRAAGVGMSKRLKEKYPEEMTIVLQHRFWDLAVREERFEVKLTFDGIPELLSVPFSAVKVFFDPSVQYGLQFEQGDSTDRPTEDGDGEGVNRPAGRLASPEKRKAGPRRPRPERVGDGDTTFVAGREKNADRPAPAPVTGGRPLTAVPPVKTTAAPEKPAGPALRPIDAKPREAKPESVVGAVADAAPANETGTSTSEAPGEPTAKEPAKEPAKVVSLDSFRKK